MYKFSTGMMIKSSNGEDNFIKVKPIYDENGFLLADKRDICDCSSAHCPGCFFPCEKCGSQKCGHMCRVNRTWRYKTSVDLSETSTLNSSKHAVEIIDLEADSNLVEQKSENLKRVSQPASDFENMDVKSKYRRNTNGQIENVNRIDLKISEKQNNLNLNNIEDKKEIVNVNDIEPPHKKEKQSLKIAEENDEKNLQQTDDKKIEKVGIIHEKQIIDKESINELKNANFKANELCDKNVQQTINAKNISIKNNKDSEKMIDSEKK